MTAKQHGLKKYIVKLSDDERDQLNALIDKGKHPARKLLKARILLKADASVAGPGWADGEIAAAARTGDWQSFHKANINYIELMINKIEHQVNRINFW